MNVGAISSRRAFLRRAVGGCLAIGSQRVWAGAPQVNEQGAAERRDESPVAAVRPLGKQFLDNAVGVTGADGATSLVLPSGESLWIFGDTIEGPFDSIHGLDLTPFRSNTGALAPPQNASHGVKSFRFLATDDGRRPRQLVPFAANEDPSRHRVWAIHGAAFDERAYLFYHRITLLKGVDVFVNFQLDGMGLARADANELEFKRLAAPDGTLEFWKRDEPTYGVWVEQADEYLYLWGSLMTGMFLARVRPESIEDLGAYEYLADAPTLTAPDAAPRWGKEFEPKAVLFDSVPNEMSAAYNAHLGQHVAIHALGRDGQIVMRTAPRRTGPWSAPSALYQVERGADDAKIYAAKEHPELARDGGRRIYVTYVNSASYAPEMIEVTLR